jgi:hypothetical protein
VAIDLADHRLHIAARLDGQIDGRHTDLGRGWFLPGGQQAGGEAGKKKGASGRQPLGVYGRCLHITYLRIACSCRRLNFLRSPAGIRQRLSNYSNVTFPNQGKTVTILRWVARSIPGRTTTRSSPCTKAKVSFAVNSRKYPSYVVPVTNSEASIGKPSQ